MVAPPGHRLQEWSLELHRPVPEAAVALAHSLAGSSATVGFAALSDLARQLEHALQHVQLLPHGLAEHAQACNAAADDIRRLLHQFAAGFLRPNPSVRERLEAVLRIEVSSGAAPLEAMAQSPDTLELEFGDLAMQDEVADRRPNRPGRPASQRMTSQMPQGRTWEAASSMTAPSMEAIARAVAAVDDIDDDIDALDVIDPTCSPSSRKRRPSCCRPWARRCANGRPARKT